MSVILLLSLGLRLAATGWLLFLLWRLQDWRIGFLSCTLGLMSAQLGLPAFLHGHPWTLLTLGGLDELPGLAVSVLMLLAVVYMVPVLTENTRTEQQLRTALQEKEVLLREVHHRVKNNLQVIASLLSLQSDYVADPSDHSLLEESENRVRAMALVHEQLYQSDNFAQIDFTTYVHSLANDLLQFYQTENKVISLHVEGETLPLDIETAIPCGLLIGELISNACKHAFLDGKDGTIRLSLHAPEPSHYCIEVQDSGIGIPREIDFPTTQSLGLQLVSALVDQIRGTITLKRQLGTTFTLTFPANA